MVRAILGICLILGSISFTRADAPPATRLPLVRVVDLNVGESQEIELLVYTDGRRAGQTCLFDPKTKIYSNGGPVPRTASEETLTMFSSRVYDPELGVLAIFLTDKAWNMGDPRPGKLNLDRLALRTFAYDVKSMQWRDLAPKNQEKVPSSGVQLRPDGETLLTIHR